MYAHRHRAVAVGVARADDRDRESLFAVFAEKELLAGDLVARVLPEGILQRGLFRDPRALRRLLVGRSRADVYVLSGLPAEEAPVALHLGRLEADKVAHAVPLLPRQLARDIRLVGDVSLDLADARRDFAAIGSTVKQGQLPGLVLCEPGGNGGADGTGTADEKGLFTHIVCYVVSVRGSAGRRSSGTASARPCPSQPGRNRRCAGTGCGSRWSRPA